MKMKRIALVLTLVLVLSMSATSFAASNPFSDLPAGHWAYDSIVQLAAVGLVEGYPDGTFGGARTLTRYEAAMIFARALARLETLVDAGVKAEVAKNLVPSAAGLGEDEVEAIVNRILTDNLDELALGEQQLAGRLRKVERNLAALSNAEGDFTTLYGMVGNLDADVAALSQDTKAEFTTLYGLVNGFEGDLAELEKSLDAKIIDLANVNEAEFTNLRGLVAGYQGDVAKLEQSVNSQVLDLANIITPLSNEFARELDMLGVRVDALESKFDGLDNLVNTLDGRVNTLDNKLADGDRVQINGVAKFNYSNAQVFEIETDNDVKIALGKGILDNEYETELGKFESELQLTLATKISDSVKVNLFGKLTGKRPIYFTELSEYTVEILSETPVTRLVLGTVNEVQVKSRFSTNFLDIQPRNGALADLKLGAVDINLVGGVKGNDGLAAVAAKYSFAPEFGLKLGASKLLDNNLVGLDDAKSAVSLGVFGDVAGLNYDATLVLDRYAENPEDNSLIDFKLGTKIGILSLDGSYAKAGENFATDNKLTSTGFIDKDANSRLELGAKANLFGMDLAVENYQEKQDGAADKLIDATMFTASTDFNLGVPVKVSGKFGRMEDQPRKAAEAKVAVSGLSLFNVDVAGSYTYASNYIKDNKWREADKWLDKDVSIVAVGLGYDVNWNGAPVKLGYDFGLTIPHADTAEAFGNETSHLVKADYVFAKDLKLNFSARQVKGTELDPDKILDDVSFKFNELKAGFEYKF